MTRYFGPDQATKRAIRRAPIRRIADARFVDGVHGFSERSPAEKAETHGVALRHHEGELGGPAVLFHRPGDRGGRLDHFPAPATHPRDHDGAFRFFKRGCDALRLFPRLVSQVGDRRGRGVEQVRHRETQPGQIVRGRAKGGGRHLVQLGGNDGGHIQIARLLVDDLADRGVVPFRNLETDPLLVRPAAQPLAQ